MFASLKISFKSDRIVLYDAKRPVKQDRERSQSSSSSSAAAAAAAAFDSLITSPVNSAICHPVQVQLPV